MNDSTIVYIIECACKRHFATEDVAHAKRLPKHDQSLVTFSGMACLLSLSFEMRVGSYRLFRVSIIAEKNSIPEILNIICFNITRRIIISGKINASNGRT